jgi:hypothetical protein
MAFIEVIRTSEMYHSLWRLDRVVGVREFEDKNQIIIADGTDKNWSLNIYANSTVNIIESEAQKELAQILYHRLLHQKWPVNYITINEWNSV